MTKSRHVQFLSALKPLLVASFMVAGCDCGQCAPDPTPLTPTPIVYYRMAPMAPPAPQAEDVENPQTPRDFVWIAGYWAYDNDRFEWIPGTLTARPSPTAVWSPDHWVERTYGWAFEAGYWQ
jgi:hypothetical protein